MKYQTITVSPSVVVVTAGAHSSQYNENENYEPGAAHGFPWPGLLALFVVACAVGYIVRPIIVYGAKGKHD